MKLLQAKSLLFFSLKKEKSKESSACSFWFFFLCVLSKSESESDKWEESFLFFCFCKKQNFLFKMGKNKQFAFEVAWLCLSLQLKAIITSDGVCVVTKNIADCYFLYCDFFSQFLLCNFQLCFGKLQFYD